MKKLILVQKDDVCFFSNPNTGSENESFEYKLEGVKILMTYVKDELITKCNGLELLEALIKLRNFPIGPVSKRDQLVADNKSLVAISEARSFLKRLTLVETANDLPKLVVCENCKNHASFIGKEFITADFDNQKDASEALDELFERGKVNKTEKEKLEIQILTSGLPKISKDQAAFMN